MRPPISQPLASRINKLDLEISISLARWRILKTKTASKTGESVSRILQSACMFECDPLVNWARGTKCQIATIAAFFQLVKAQKDQIIEGFVDQPMRIGFLDINIIQHPSA